MLSIRPFALMIGLFIASSALAGPVTDPADISPLLPGERLAEGVQVRQADGGVLDLSAKLASGHHIVIFYRGGWCPYCTRHLGELAELEAELVELGYEILAISPDRPERLSEYREKVTEKLHATLLSDSKMQAADAFGLAFQVPDELVEKYKGWDIDLEKDSGETHHLLPVPAAYVFVDGVIQFGYVNPDYKTRVPGELLLTAARLGMAAQEAGR